MVEFLLACARVREAARSDIHRYGKKALTAARKLHTAYLEERDVIAQAIEEDLEAVNAAYRKIRMKWESSREFVGLARRVEVYKGSCSYPRTRSEVPQQMTDLYYYETSIADVRRRVSELAEQRVNMRVQKLAVDALNFIRLYDNAVKVSGLPDDAFLARMQKELPKKVDRATMAAMVKKMRELFNIRPIEPLGPFVPRPELTQMAAKPAAKTPAKKPAKKRHYSGKPSRSRRKS